MVYMTSDCLKVINEFSIKSSRKNSLERLMSDGKWLQGGGPTKQCKHRTIEQDGCDFIPFIPTYGLGNICCV